MARFPNIVKTALLGLGVFLSAILLTGIIINVFYGKEVKTYLLTRINQSLRSEVVVKEDDITFGVFRHFPNASVEFTNIVMKDAVDSTAAGATKKQTGNLLDARKVSLQFNIVSLFRKHYTISKIVIKDAQVNLAVDEKGRENYQFWKTSTDTVKSESAPINLQRIVLDNVAITYINKKAHHDYLLAVKEATLKGHFGDESYTLGAEGNLLVNHLRIDDFNYVDKKKAKLTLHMNVNSKTDEYAFEKSRIRLDDVTFDVNGTYTAARLSDLFDLKIDAHKAGLDDFLKILPPMKGVQDYFDRFRSSGNLACSITIKGPLDKKNTPRIDIIYDVNDGKITPKESSLSLKNVALKGRYMNKNAAGKPVDALQVNSFTASLGGRTIKADARLDDLRNPFLTLHAAANLDLDDVHHFIKPDTLKKIKGDMAVHLSFAGRIKDLPRSNAKSLYHVDASGTVKLSDVSFELKNNPLDFKNFNGTLTFNNNDISLSDCRGKISSSDFELDGVFKDLVTFMLIPKQSTTIHANLVSKRVDLDELLANKNSTAENDTSSYKLRLSPYLNCKLNVSIADVQLRRFRASSLRGQINLSNQVMSSSNLTFSAMNGTVAMDGKINCMRDDSVLMSCNAELNGLDIKQVFYQLENFHQNTMVDDNLKGKATATVKFSSLWSNTLRINSSKVDVETDVKIENGELINFRPILPLAKYIKVAELNHIRFSTLQNHVSIHNRKISFPNMEINSSAINLSASGTHDFDNMVDYHLKLLLSDILGKKVRQRGAVEDFGEIEDDGLGHTKLFIAMKGPVDDPKFSYDKKAVQQKITADIKQGRENFKSLIKNEFAKKDDAANKTQPVKKKRQELQLELE